MSRIALCVECGKPLFHCLRLDLSEIPDTRLVCFGLHPNRKRSLLSSIPPDEHLSFSYRGFTASQLNALIEDYKEREATGDGLLVYIDQASLDAIQSIITLENAHG